MKDYSSIEFIAKGIEIPSFNREKIKNWISKIICNHHKEIGEIIYFFCDDKEIIHLNKFHFSHDYPTDIITINQTVGHIISAEIFIGINTIRNNAKTYNTDFCEELKRVFIHGILHLLSYTDDTQLGQLTMRKMEDNALQIWKQMN